MQYTDTSYSNLLEFSESARLRHIGVNVHTNPSGHPCSAAILDDIAAAPGWCAVNMLLLDSVRHGLILSMLVQQLETGAQRHALLWYSQPNIFDRPSSVQRIDTCRQCF